MVDMQDSACSATDSGATKTASNSAAPLTVFAGLLAPREPGESFVKIDAADLGDYSGAMTFEAAQALVELIRQLESAQ